MQTMLPFILLHILRTCTYILIGARQELKWLLVSTHDRDFFQASAIIVYRFVIDRLIKSGGCLIQKKWQVGCSVQNLKQANINASNAAPFSVLLLHNYVHTYSYCSYDNINTSFTHIVVRHFSSPSAYGCLFSHVQAKVGYVVWISSSWAMTACFLFSPSWNETLKCYDVIANTPACIAYYLILCMYVCSWNGRRFFSLSSLK